MAKHRAGDRRIISISIPEETARKLDRKVGKGMKEGRSATITRMIERGLSHDSTPPAEDNLPQRSASAEPGSFRVEKDTMGDVQVPSDRYYGAQTARSVVNFDIGDDTMPRSVIRAFGILKGAAAQTNVDLGQLDAQSVEY